LRDGRHVGTLPRGEATPDRVVEMMIGRSLEEYFPSHVSGSPGETVLRVTNLSSPGKFQDVSFDVRRGEIVGFAGLVGAGRSEVARAIFGLDPDARGSIELEGRPLPIGRVRTAMRRGAALLPEDRKRQGLVTQMSGRANLSLAMLERLNRLGLLDRVTESRNARDLYAQLNVRAPSIETPVVSLSGGNQQKVVLGKWLARGARLLIVDEPTRGVDVGAKAAIHKLLDELAQQGVAMILISSELPEVLNLATRILVMREGRIVAEFKRADATQEKVLRAMAGVTDHGQPRSQPA
jgi:ABC-type sugar transport system ATPase subunit